MQNMFSFGFSCFAFLTFSDAKQNLLVKFTVRGIQTQTRASETFDPNLDRLDSQERHSSTKYKKC